MLTPRSTLARRVLAALDATPSRIPVILGGCGSGRTTLAHQLRDRIGRGSTQYLDVERTATTPERFFRAVVAAAPFPVSDQTPAGARAAFDSTLTFLTRAKTGGGEPATFLLDEFLELRTFESFPGLRHVLRDLLEGLAGSPNRFVLTTRYVARAHRLLRDATSRFEVMHLPSLAASDVTEILAPTFNGYEQMPTDDRDYLGRAVQALTDGRAAYVRGIGDTMSQMGRGADPISALTALMSVDGALNHWCQFCYELRLHRARGYGALKAILDVLAEAEPLTLTEISHRLHRTPGSTKDYLSWLEDVDLVTSRQKRYSFSDPLLRVWVRLHCRPSAPTEDDLAREVHRYALPRLPQQQDPQSAPAEATYAMTASPGTTSGIIEID